MDRVLVKNTNESWINCKWRPAMGWMYFAVCIFDFILFPVLWSLLQATMSGNVTASWEPITLHGAGLFHVAMGAILGIAVYGRTKEKVEGVQYEYNTRYTDKYEHDDYQTSKT
jgi:hypothetical protein